MLLSLMRKHAKSWLIKLLIAIIAVVFVFYFGYSFNSDKNLKVAYVNGELISEPEYQKAYQDMLDAVRNRYKDMWDENLIKSLNLRDRALENLINQRLMTQAARRLGLDVTENEIQKAIMGYPAFQTSGQFDVGRYRSLLGYNRMSPEDFEMDMAQNLIDKKLRQFLFAFLDITDPEIQDYYAFMNEKIKISFVQFKSADYKEGVKETQAGLESYFKENQENYRLPKQIKVAFIEIDPETFKGKVEITEKEIDGYYEYNKDGFSEPKRVKARHILFKVNKDAGEEEAEKVRKKVLPVLEMAKKGEDFSELAKKYSEGPTKAKGGDLGFFEKGKMVPAFEGVAFALKAGEISEIVRTSFGYHIIKVEEIQEARTKPLEEVREEIVSIISNNISAELAHEKGLNITDQMPYDVVLPTYAKEQGFDAKASDFFAGGTSVPGIADSEKMSQSLFALDKGETSELVQLGDKFYIFQVAESRESFIPELKDVEESVKDDYLDSESEKAARNAADKYLKELKEGKSWEELAKEKDKLAQTTDFFSRKDPFPKIGYAPDLSEMAFGLSAEKRYPENVFGNPQGTFVIRWDASQGIDEKKFEEEKEQFRTMLAQNSHRRVFELWLQNLKKNAKIEILRPVSGSSK